MARIRLIISIVVFLIPASAFAQSGSGGDVFIGPAFLNGKGQTLTGFNISLSGKIDGPLGLMQKSPVSISVVGDIGWAKGSESFTYQSTSGNARFETTYKVTSVMAGFRLSEKGVKKLTPYVHILLGVSNTSANTKITNGNGTVPPVTVKLSSGTGFTSAVGGGVDLRIRKPIAFRLIQVDYISKPGMVRISTGIVLRF